MTASRDDRSYEEQLAAARAFIEANDRFLVVAHVNPDGDAAASTCATGWMLERLGKKYTLVNENSMPGKFDHLWGFDRIVRSDELDPSERFGAVISVDCADESRIGKARALFAGDVRLLNIDHHPTNDRFGDVRLIRDDAAATVEILYDLASELKLAPTPEFATAIYTGLLTDTGGFRYSNTSPKVMRIASELLACGVPGHKLAERLLERISRSHIELLRRALATLQFACGGKLCWVSVSQEDIRQTGATAEDMDGLVLYPRNIEGVEVGMLFKETEDGTVKVSFRSNTYADVAAVAKSFGGGGHVRASGCTIPGTLAEAIERVVKEVGQHFQ